MNVCPFCSLHCDDLTPNVVASKGGGDYKNCGLAKRGYGIAGIAATETTARIGKESVSIDDAVAAAATALAAAKLARVHGQSADITAQRQAVRLSQRLGGVFTVTDEHPAAFALGKSHTTSFGECAVRADLVVLFGDPKRLAATVPRAAEKLFAPAPVFGNKRRVIKFTAAAPLQQLADLQLAVKNPALSHPLAKPLKAARYAVLVLCPPLGFRAHQDLLLAAAAELLELLNQNGRATLLALNPFAGSPGANMVANVMTSRMPPFSANGFAADAVLWLDLFGFDVLPSSLPKPLIMLGRVDNRRADIFIPAAVPGIDGNGKMMRGDSVSIAVLRRDKKGNAPSAAEILERLMESGRK